MWFDILLVLILLAGLVLGYRRGFMAQIGAFIGVVLGIICCQVFAGSLADKFTSPGDSMGTILLNNVMAYLIIFIVCYLLGRLVGHVIVKTAKILHLGVINNIAGAIFKTAEYMLCLSILLNLWIGIFPDTKMRSSHSGLTEVVIDFAPTVFGSETVGDVFDAVGNAATSTKNSLEKAVD